MVFFKWNPTVHVLFESPFQCFLHVLIRTGFTKSLAEPDNFMIGLFQLRKLLKLARYNEACIEENTCI